MDKGSRTPSPLALKILEGMRLAATQEIRGHLKAGREVHGTCGGKSITLKGRK